MGKMGFVEVTALVSAVDMADAMVFFHGPDMV